MSRYFQYDYHGMSEEELHEAFPDAVRRLISNLPASLSVADVYFGVDHQFSRTIPVEEYYTAWVCER